MRRRRTLAWVAACFVALRALVPIGFMVSVSASGAAVTLCPEYAPVPPAAEAQHAHHHGHDHAHPGHGAVANGAGSAADGSSSTTLQLPASDAHGLCPFAAAAHSAWLGAKSAVVLAVPRGPHRAAAAAADASLPRLHLCTSRSPRGPPALNLA